MLDPCGAQRLTASEVWHSLFSPKSTLSILEVLNALRHQRFGTFFSKLKAAGNLIVLNALRHQRFGTCKTANSSDDRST